HRQQPTFSPYTTLFRTVAEQPAVTEQEAPSEPEQAVAPQAQQPKPQQPVTAPEKAFPGNIIDGILNNPMYQIVNNITRKRLLRGDRKSTPLNSSHVKIP